MTSRVIILSVFGFVILAVAFAFKLKGPPAPVPSEPFIAWAKTHAVVLQASEPRHGFEELQPLKEIVGRARVVGLGEATHGTREFFQFKHRVLEFLVQEMGFTAFALEACFGEAAKVNDYVLGGSGDAPTVVRGMRFWCWDTEEMVALVEWLREHNLKPGTTRKVTFQGFDLQLPALPLREAVTYLSAVDAKLGGEFEALAAQHGKLQAGAPDDRAQRDAVVVRMERLLECLDANRARLTSAGGERDWRRARQNARVALQGVMYYGTAQDDRDRVRDAFMAENVQWILAGEGPTGRVLLWAHNGHVSRRAEALFGRIPIGGMDWNPMGWHLRKALGADYRAIGFAFNRGSFRADPRKAVKSVGAAGPETFDGVLARVGPPMFLLNLQRPVDDSGVVRWLDAAHDARKVGVFYLPPEDDANNRLRVVPRENFDAVVFFDQTTATRANPPPIR